MIEVMCHMSFYITPTTLCPPPPNNVLLMANVMSFHHTAKLLRGEGYILLFTGILGNI
jgi:hypothetical protein